MLPKTFYQVRSLVMSQLLPTLSLILPTPVNIYNYSSFAVTKHFCMLFEQLLDSSLKHLQYKLSVCVFLTLLLVN